ncbi:MAG: DNA alkylation repair protein [Bacteroidetes bacterium]|nr:MAG: DNA alkylation repair protein [Bacteroidota bacterium]
MTLTETLDHLKRRGSAANVRGMARFGITAAKAFGVPAPAMRELARRIGTDHRLSAALWKSGWYDARILAALVADPSTVTRAGATRLAAQFDSWAVCDVWCAEVFCRLPEPLPLIARWTADEREFVKRAGFVMMAALAVHRKELPDALFRSFLPVIARHAEDERNFVRKGVNWALRQIGKKNPALHRAAAVTARALRASADRTARWIGHDALRDMQSPSTRRRFERMRTRNDR